MADTNSRLAALEQENADLKARLSRLENLVPKAVPPPRDDAGVRVVTFVPGVSPNLPTEDEARALLRIVTSRFPQLKWKYSTWLTPDDELESFRAAFAFVGSLTKTENAITKFAASWWVDSAQEWCRQVGVRGVIRSLLPAIVASRDIPFCLEDRSAIWLDPYRGRGKAVDDRAWKQLLSGGDVPAPTKFEPYVDNSVGVQRVQAFY